MSWARWLAAWKRICACWLICDVFPGAQLVLHPGSPCGEPPYCGGLADESKT